MHEIEYTRICSFEIKLIKFDGESAPFFMGEIKRKLLVVVFVFTAISSGVWFFFDQKVTFIPRGNNSHW